MDRDRPAPAAIRPVAAANQPAEPAYPATVVEISGRGLGLKLRPGFELRPNHAVELSLDGTWNRGRVLWCKPGVRGTVIAAIELPPAP